MPRTYLSLLITTGWILALPVVPTYARDFRPLLWVSCATDADGDGVADGLFGVVGKWQLIRRGADFCQQAEVPTGKPRFAEVLRSNAFDVSPGTLYSARFECKGHAVSIFHVKFRWLDERGRTVKTVRGGNYEQLLSPPRRTPWGNWWDAKSAVAWLPSRERSGDWDWERWAGFYEAPEGARVARIEFWADRKGGTFCVDNVEVRQVQKRESSMKPLTLGKVAFNIKPEVRGRALVLPGPVKVELLIASDGSFLGLGRIVVRGRTVRLGDMPLAPLLLGRKPLTYRKCELLSVERAGNGFALKTALMAPDGRSDTLWWRVEPERFTIGEAFAVGVSLAFEFRSEKREVHEFLLRASWCLGGDVDGLEVPQQFPSPPGAPHIVTLTSQEAVGFAPWSKVRIGAGEWFTPLQARGASLLIFPCGLALSRYRFIHAPMEGAIAHEERFIFPLSKHLKTPKLYTLLLNKAGPETWLETFDWTGERLREFARLREEEPLPIVNFRAPFVCPPGHPLWSQLLLPDKAHWRWGTVFEWAMESALPEAKTMGFKRLYIFLWRSQATEWGRLTKEQREKVKLPSACGPLTLDVADVYGGLEGLRRLCQEAERVGLEVFAWFSTAHLSNISPLYTSHPEWALIGRGGKPFNFGYVDITGMWHPAGFGEYAVRKLAEAREAGLKGLWLDSYPVFGTGRVNYGTQKWEPHLPYIVKFQRRLQKMGYVMLLEGSGPLGIPAFGIGKKALFDRYLEAPWLLYKTSPFIPEGYFPWHIQRKMCYPFPRGAYFKLLAVKCCPIVAPDQWRDRPEMEEEIRYANKAYTRLLPLMHKVRVLPDGAGVLWEDESQRQGALWSFVDGRVDTGRPVKNAREIAGEDSPSVRGPRVQCAQWKAYALSW